MANKYKAFSLAEIIIVIGVFSLITVLVLPIGLGQLEQNSALYTARDIASGTFVIQQHANNGKDSGEFGVVYGVNSYTVYEGASLATAVWSDEVPITGGASISSVVLSGGGSEIHFTKGTLLPDKSGVIRVADGEMIYRVDINSEGLIQVIRE